MVTHTIWWSFVLSILKLNLIQIQDGKDLGKKNKLLSFCVVKKPLNGTMRLTHFGGAQIVAHVIFDGALLGEGGGKEGLDPHPLLWKWSLVRGKGVNVKEINIQSLLTCLVYQKGEEKLMGSKK